MSRRAQWTARDGVGGCRRRDAFLAQGRLACSCSCRCSGASRHW
jgi:hypothetical protein